MHETERDKRLRGSEAVVSGRSHRNVQKSVLTLCCGVNEVLELGFWGFPGKKGRQNRLTLLSHLTWNFSNTCPRKARQLE